MPTNKRPRPITRTSSDKTAAAKNPSSGAPKNGIGKTIARMAVMACDEGPNGEQILEGIANGQEKTNVDDEPNVG
jgi:hypothetical protein